MALVWLDCVMETTVTTGTGSYTLGGAVAGHFDWSGVGNGNTAYYRAFAVDALGTPTGDNEIGLGTWSTGGTLARTSILRSTNSNNAVSWGTGTKRVTLVHPADVIGRLAVTSGKTLTVSNTVTFTATDGSTVAFGAGGTVAYTANKLSAFAATTSAELAGVISDETGSGSLVFANTPTLVTPNIGAATGTSLALGGATIGSNALAVTGACALNVGTSAGTGLRITRSSDNANVGEFIARSAGTEMTCTTNQFWVNSLAVNAIGRNGSIVTINAPLDTGIAGLNIASVSGNGTAANAQMQITPSATQVSPALRVKNTAGTNSFEIAAAGSTTITATTEQLRLGYDASNYEGTTVSSTGSVTRALAGTNSSYTFTPSGTGNFLLTSGQFRAPESNSAVYSFATSTGTGFGVVSSDLAVFRSGTMYVRIGPAQLAVGGIIAIGASGAPSAPTANIASTVDGVLLLRNTALNNFSTLQFGGTTSSFPALKRSGTTLQARLADDSGFADWFSSALFITKTSAPSDGDLAASQCALWFDATNGAAKLKIKGKSADGTVVSGEVALA